ncbi:SapC family protein [Paraglaciecola aquimarina]|uniref:SapC family protein n=1 Tax=Paraglaciecola aquimarina TaxID=1235557 RepID=A0ABU3SYG0_9ALTE|nr:SapC family protein [Paraglaciecola aquimarina]MDU0355038.1 SapC family protein [Paraglaciecola aquimarina]
MAGYTILDPKQHQDLKIITTKSAELGDSHHIIPVLAEELRALVAEYPICFIKDNQTGQFGLNVLTGFELGENLFLQAQAWNASYVPLHIRRQPFMVGIKGEEGDTPTPDNTIVTINLDSPKVNKEQGEALFDEDAKPTELLSQVNRMLVNLVQGIPRTEAFVKSLLEHDLLMPVKLDLALASGEKKSFTGLYNINEEKLATLSGDTLQTFHQKGYLQACHLIMASFGQVQKLIAWKNKA